MVYHITIGGRFPHLIVGDVCVIHGIDYPFLGRFHDDKKIPHKPGVYFMIPTNKYYLKHPTSITVESAEPNKSPKNITDIISYVTNDSKVPVSREKINKEIFYTNIEPDDNYLKVLLKQVINSMKIDIRDYKLKFGSDNRMNNMRRLLTTPGNLTYEKFEEWMDILGYSHKVTIYNPDGTIFNPDQGV